MSNEKRIQSVRRKLFSALGKAGIKVEQEPRARYVTLNGIKTYVNVVPVGVFAPDGAPLRMSFGPFDGSRKRLSIREPKTGFKYEDIVPRFRSLIADEKLRLEAARKRGEIVARNNEIAAKIKRDLHIKHGSLSVVGSSHLNPGKVEVSFSAEMSGPDAAVLMKAIQRAMTSIATAPFL